MRPTAKFAPLRSFAKTRPGFAGSAIAKTRPGFAGSAIVSFVVLTSAVAACGGSEKAAPKTAAAPAPPPKPRCPPGADESPLDAKGRMESMQADVKKCWTLGTPGKAESTVKVQVTVGESGAVREAKVMGDGDPSAVQCMVKSLKAAKFSRFCGPDVSISWTYALQ